MRIILGLLAAFTAPAFADTDPLLSDPVTIDADNPPGMVELQIPSGDAMMNGHMYLANGAGPHPTVVMLHGFPGNEKNLDTAQMLRRAGFNVLYFHYRGAWGSGGDYSVRNVVADAAAAVAFVRAQGQAGKDRIDPSRVSLFGHSLGGFNALMNGAMDAELACTVAAAPADLVNFVEAADPNTVVSADANVPVPGLKDYSFADLIKETMANKAAFNLQSRMVAFKGRALMIVTAKQDVVVPPEGQQALADAAKAGGADPFRHVVMEGDHGFAWTRVAFNTTVTSWMSEHCR
ncbi:MULTISPECIES: alpha/beta hydrolase family protein [Kordiimonas]|jgi:hypothetical protein|uniref:alpha/beta hydrolase family protein n=1 Tax=Kordiimonas TaxID=288021 RepID=UPI00257DE42E|nr:alpha/beta fold hydrolase [Kordiimonas sp. UBA4487]